MIQAVERRGVSLPTKALAHVYLHRRGVQRPVNILRISHLCALNAVFGSLPKLLGAHWPSFFESHGIVLRCQRPVLQMCCCVLANFKGFKWY
jgi:hypothetical protein